MASDPSIIHEPNIHGFDLAPGRIGALCSHRNMPVEAYAQPEAHPEYGMSTLLMYASQEFYYRHLPEFSQDIFTFIERLPYGPFFIAECERIGHLWGLDRDHWPSFNIFSPKDRLRIMRRAVRLLWEECWEDWLWMLDPEKQSQIWEESQWAVRQGIPPYQTAYERQRTTALRWILRHPFQAVQQIEEALERRYQYSCLVTKREAK